MEHRRLREAIRNCDRSVIEKIFESNCYLDVNSKGDDELTLLQLVIKHSFGVNYDISLIIRELVRRGSDIEIRDGFARTPLIVVSSKFNINSMIELIKLGAKVNAIDGHGDNSLHITCRKGYYQGSMILIEAGIDINAKNEADDTPLHYAAKEDSMNRCYQTNFIKKLIESGADVSVKNNKGQTFLDLLHQDIKNEIEEFLSVDIKEPDCL